MEYRNKGVYCLDFLLEISLVFAEIPLHFCRCSPLTILNFFFDFTKMSSPQRLHGEPSPSKRRRLAVSMTSLRQLVESKGKLQSIPTCASDNPLKCFSQSTKALHQQHSLVLPSSCFSDTFVNRHHHLLLHLNNYNFVLGQFFYAFIYFNWTFLPQHCFMWDFNEKISKKVFLFSFFVNKSFLYLQLTL